MVVSDHRARAWLLGPLLAACVAFGLATWAWAVAALLLAAAIPSLWLRRGLDWSARVQLLTGGAVAAAALLLGPVGAPEVVFPPGATASLHPLAVRLALALVAVSVLRSYVRHPAGGVPASLLAMAASLAASGYAPWNSTYPVLVAAFALASVPALRASPGGGPAWQSLDARRKAAVALMLLLTAVLAAGVATAIPVLHRGFVSAFLRYESAKSESGLTDSILLGGFTDIVESDEVVLRVHGTKADYLRGFVLSRYRNGAWLPSESDLATQQFFEAAPAARSVEVRAARVDPRYYLPLHARNAIAGSGRVIVDRMGLVRAASGKAADITTFDIGPRDRWPVAPPNVEDAAVPADARPALEKLVAEWTAGAKGTREKLERIESHLRSGFRYSLQHERRTRSDPVLDFLFVNQVGHCEYFASAMALLGRTAGAPTRVVSGYRVQEQNPWGGYHVVRARDAHAWVEAWIDGEGWVTFDPTPPSALAALRPRETPMLGAWADVAADLWGRASQSGAMKPGNLAAGIAGLALVAGAGVWLKRRVSGPRRGAPKGGDATESTCLPLLSELLATLGYVRADSETLEAFAARVRRDGDHLPILREASELVEDYARLRYGEIGDMGELERRIAALRDREADRPGPSASA